MNSPQRREERKISFLWRYGLQLNAISSAGLDYAGGDSAAAGDCRA
jgi:hypothetical protein